MAVKSSYDAGPYVPDTADLAAVREAATGCKGCPLHENATQTVFGEGSQSARVMLVGEQPGDREDREGAPFVGPAGRLLDRALVEADIDRGDAYVTNAVKHFKYKQQDGGKRRIHQAPGVMEMAACRPWLLAELRLLDPEVIVALGATAGKALLGPAFRVTKQRGVLLPMPDLDALGTKDAPERTRDHGHVLATIHPSAVLRAEDRDAVYAGLVSDLNVAAQAL